MQSADKIKFCRVVGVLLLSDGVVTEAERQFMGTLMGQFGLSPGERNAVVERLGHSTDIMQDVRDLKPYAESLMRVLRAAAGADGQFVGVEKGLLEAVDAALTGQGGPPPPPSQAPPKAGG